MNLTDRMDNIEAHESLASQSVVASRDFSWAV
jgi:hypothetical protein